MRYEMLQCEETVRDRVGDGFDLFLNEILEHSLGYELRPVLRLTIQSAYARTPDIA